MTGALFLSVLRIEPRGLVYVVSLALVTALLCVCVLISLRGDTVVQTGLELFVAQAGP